ncbi:hypothetical protein BJQ94_06610 [Cryobacterium sp. SO2]|uniref:hypothetical protein n=1 Tax=Cryobacterium sp. SO2 TaxID=1897060 RepID=UPI00223CDAAA|nr:hypothetical protein [Cryobacterium sp. SO2]WEO78697.1 hypothetical protein BJQ94_06610 [Cryobacterium sp. SO2]
MSQKKSGPLSKFNLALALLWLVDVVVTGAGYLILTSSNASQADFYTSQSSDYVSYFGAQSGSNLGATLIGAGVIGVLITLAAHAVSWSLARNAEAVASVTTVDDEPDFDFDDTDFDADEKAAVEAEAAQTAAATTVSPTVVADATEATPAAAPAETPATDAPATKSGDDDSSYGPTTTR